MFLLLFFTLYLFSPTTAFERVFYHPEHAATHFEEFIATHGKTYSPAEKLRRFEIFKENLRFINYQNSFNESIHGITEFADMSEEEYDAQYNSCVGKMDGSELRQESKCQVLTDTQITTNTAPATLDYRQSNAVTPMKNQGNCQSCWAFASVGSIEGAYALKHNQLLSFSPQQLMDCLRSSGHCQKGSFMTWALSELMGQPGVMLEADYPYVGRNLPCQFKAAKAKAKVTGCFNYSLKNEDKLKEALARFGPIAIAINTNGLRFYKGEIVTANTCPPAQPGHAVLLVGYGTEGGQDYWLIKNSYGENWGPLGGYFKLARKQNVCGMMNPLAASAIVA